jgi:HK97 family phage major capsid protein
VLVTLVSVTIDLDLEVKSATTTGRSFRGMASTPSLDSHDQSVDPLGLTYQNPVPLLLNHDQRVPVGSVVFGQATAAGLPFDATIPTVNEPGTLKELTDLAAHMVAHRLIRNVSIGMLTKSVAPLAKGLRILAAEVREMSLAAVPANLDAAILSIKSASAVTPATPAASGHVHLRARKDAPHMENKFIPDAIKDTENHRAATHARMTELMSKSHEAGLTLEGTESEEYDRLADDLTKTDAHLLRLKSLEASNVAAATPIAPIARIKTASDLRGGIVTVKPNVPPGTAFVRLACAKLVCNGNVFEAAEYAKRWDDSTPEVALALKAAVAPGTATDATWASPLVNQGISADFIELLRAATILGNIPNLRKVPFNTKVPAQSAGGTYGWVGEAKPKPVTKLAFTSTALGIAKAAGIIVLTEELVRLSNPSAEELVRKDMIDGIARFLDAQFIDPAVAAVAGVNPASITNGAPTAAATANPLADILGLINHFATNNISVDGLTFIMNAANALALSFRSNLDGSPQFPGITINGGSWKGLNFVVSNTVTTNVVALQPQLILYADEGGVTIDASREASLQMDSAPMSPADATTVYVSLWQTNSVGLRAERFVNWLRANPNAVKYLTAAAWPAPAGTTLAAEEAPTRSTGKGA